MGESWHRRPGEQPSEGSAGTTSRARCERVEIVDALTDLVANGAVVPAVSVSSFGDLPSALGGVAAATTCGRPVAVTAVKQSA